jgi:hypothetical protein
MHAYVLNMDLLPQVNAALNGLTRVIDHYFLEDVQPRSNAYVAIPYLAFQSDGQSDISGTYAKQRRLAEYVWR